MHIRNHLRWERYGYMKENYYMNLPESMMKTYIIICKLNTGGVYGVYKAWHIQMCNYVVIRETRYDGGMDSADRCGEAETLKSISGVYIPRVLDCLTGDNRSYIVTEYLDGKSLDILLRQGRRFTLYQLHKWYMQLAEALEYIHGHNVFHRDIKPANIVLTRGGGVRIIDFGSAIIGASGLGNISYSRGYASPQQQDAFIRLQDCSRRRLDKSVNKHINNKNLYDKEPHTSISECATVLFGYDDTQPGQDDPAYANGPWRRSSYGVDWANSDIYSLGATMYHLLSGSRPPILTDEDVYQLPMAMCSCGISHIIERSMRFNPEERYSTARELREAIQGVEIKESIPLAWAAGFGYNYLKK